MTRKRMRMAIRAKRRGELCLAQRTERKVFKYDKELDAILSKYPHVPEEEILALRNNPEFNRLAEEFN